MHIQVHTVFMEVQYVIFHFTFKGVTAVFKKETQCMKIGHVGI